MSLISWETNQSSEFWICKIDIQKRKRYSSKNHRSSIAFAKADMNNEILV